MKENETANRGSKRALTVNTVPAPILQRHEHGTLSRGCAHQSASERHWHYAWGITIAKAQTAVHIRGVRAAAQPARCRAIRRRPPVL